MPSSSEMPASAPRAWRWPEPSLDDAIARRQRVGPRQVELALGQSARAPVGVARRIERRAVHLDEPPAHHRLELHVGVQLSLQAMRAHRRPAPAARSRGTGSAHRAAGSRASCASGRRARRSAAAAPCRPSASAPICRLDANGRRRRLARPKRHETPRCGTRFSSASSSHASAPAATSKPPTPPSMIARGLRLVRLPRDQRRRRSRRRNRRRARRRCADAAGRDAERAAAARSRVRRAAAARIRTAAAMPVANAVSAGMADGQGSVSMNAVDSKRRALAGRSARRRRRARRR